MRRLSPDSWLLLGMLLLLLTLTAAVTFWQAQQETQYPRLASFSAQPDGAQALREWLGILRYETGQDMPGRFLPPPAADVLFMLEPQFGISEAAWQAVDEWIEEGGTLVLAGDSFGALSAFEHFDVAPSPLPTDAQLPTHIDERLTSPPLGTLDNLRPWWGFREIPPDATRLLEIGNDALLISFAQGDGRVVLSTLSYPLTNAGLKEEGNPELVLNLISLAPPGGVIWFDEWHHGLQTGDGGVPGPGVWLRTSPAGQGLLYAGLVLLLFVVLRGRRFGRPVPLPESNRRRAPLEHVQALANLSRRAGHRRAAQEHYHSRLKRALGRRYHLDPGLPDDEFMRRVAEFRPDFDVEALATLLARLRAANISESELLELAQQVNNWLERPERTMA